MNLWTRAKYMSTTVTSPAISRGRSRIRATRSAFRVKQDRSLLRGKLRAATNQYQPYLKCCSTPLWPTCFSTPLWCPCFSTPLWRTCSSRGRAHSHFLPPCGLLECQPRFGARVRAEVAHMLISFHHTACWSLNPALVPVFEPRSRTCSFPSTIRPVGVSTPLWFSCSSLAAKVAHLLISFGMRPV